MYVQSPPQPRVSWAVQPRTRIEKFQSSVKYSFWETRDGIFRVYRVEYPDRTFYSAEYRQGDHWMPVDADPLRLTSCKYYESLSDAMLACENRMRLEKRIDFIMSNREAVVDQQPPTPEKIQENGHSSCSRPAKAPGKPAKASSKPARASGGSEEASPPTKAPKRGPGRPRKNPDQPPKKPIELDRFGNRKNSLAAQVNRALNKSWQTAEMIAEKTEVPLARVRNQLTILKKNGHIIKKDHSYRLSPVE